MDVRVGGDAVAYEFDFLELGSRASLDRSPRSNWVEKSGQLPGYVREIARAIEKTGKTLSAAIAIAISRIKKWASGVGVNKDTQAKSIKALAEWTALKAKNRARMLVKTSSWIDEMDAAADLIQLTPLEDLLIQLSVEREAAQQVALSRVLAAADSVS